MWGGQLGGGVCTQTPSLGMALDGFGTFWSLKMWCCTWYMDLHGNFPNLMFVYRETLMPDLRTWHATCESKDVCSQAETRCCDIVGNFTIWRSDTMNLPFFSSPLFIFFLRMFHAEVSSKTRSDGSLSLHTKAREGRGCCGSLSFFYLRQRTILMKTANQRG